MGGTGNAIAAPHEMSCVKLRKIGSRRMEFQADLIAAGNQQMLYFITITRMHVAYRIDQKIITVDVADCIQSMEHKFNIFPFQQGLIGK